MKVVFLHPPLYPVNYHFFNLLGRKVELIVYQYGEAPSDHKEWKATSLNYLCENFQIKVFGKGYDSIKNQLSLKSLRELKNDNPDIVVSIAFWIPSIVASLLKSILNFQFIIATDAISETEKYNSILRNKLRTFIANNTDCMIAASKLSNDYLKTFVAKKKIFLSVQTIDVNNWRKGIIELENKEELKIKLFNKKNNLIMLGVGNYMAKKNWLAVIEIMDKFPNLYFVLVGDGNERLLYEAKIKNLALEKRVLLVGSKSGKELKKFYKAADFLIFPSLHDQFGFVVPEALCSSLPVICTKNAGAEVLIKENYNGYIMKNDMDMVDKIYAMIKNHKNLSHNAYASIEKISLENRSLEFFNIFNKVVKL